MIVRNIVELGGLVHQRRKDLGLTQAALAEQAGVSRAWVVSLERARRVSIDFERLKRVLRVLDLAMDISPAPQVEMTDQDRALAALFDTESP